MDTSRFVYNLTVSKLNNKEIHLNWFEIKGQILSELPEWTKKVPYQIKSVAIRDACISVQNAIKKFKKGGGNSNIKFRSRKSPTQSCFIPLSAIKNNGIYPKILGNLKYTENLPDNVKDSRLVWRAGYFFLKIPFKTLHVPYGENQAHVVAIDPGVRNFITFFSNSSCGHIGEHDFSRIQRLATHADNLISRMSKSGKQKKKQMRLALHKMFLKIENLIDELHHKTALFLVKNFDIILLPTFETSEMVQKFTRKIKSKTVRNLMTFKHFKFKNFLKHKSIEYGKKVVDVCEAYTSKTHPETGELINIGSAKTIKLLNGNRVDRDLSGARNILLRALTDSSMLKNMQLTINFN